MVTVMNYALRKTSEGREFYVLILQGGLAFVQSRQSGNFNATVKQCSIPSTFDEATAKQMIGERVAHNHPSCNKIPSDADIELTRKLKEAGKILEITMLDHLILLSEGYLSIADEGIL